MAWKSWRILAFIAIIEVAILGMINYRHYFYSKLLTYGLWMVLNSQIYYTFDSFYSMPVDAEHPARIQIHSR